jgi:hypothetical protein
MAASTPGMLMPKASMDLDDFSPGNKNKVGSAGEIVAVESKAESKPVHEAAHDQFWPHPRLLWRQRSGRLQTTI